MELKCKGKHIGHLCVLVSQKKFDEIREMVRNPKFMCFNCGRVADSEENEGDTPTVH